MLRTYNHEGQDPRYILLVPVLETSLTLRGQVCTPNNLYMA